MIVQKYLHDLAAWNALPTEEQESIIGRTKLDDIELDDAVKPANSHDALNTIVDSDGEEIDIVRDNMAFGDAGAGEYGTYFIGYAAPRDHRADAHQHVRRRAARQLRPDARRLDRAVTGQPVLRAVVGDLEILDDLPSAADASAAPAAGDGPPPTAPDRPLRRTRCGIGSLRGVTPMDNLHRSLAPISDAAWSQIEEEASRTLKRHLAGAPGGGRVRPAGRRAVRRRHRAPADIAAPPDGVLARRREVRPVNEFRVPFTAGPEPIDDVVRGAQDSDWQPVKDAAPHDRLRRGPGRVRGLRGRRDHRHQAGVEQPAA